MPHPDDFKEDYEHRRGDWSGEHPSLFDEVMDFVDDALETILFDPVKPMKLIDKGEYEEAAEDILWEMTTGKFKKAGKAIDTFKKLDKGTKPSRNISKEYSSRKKAIDAVKIMIKPKKKAGPRVTRQTKNKAGTGNQFKTDKGTQSEHIHDSNHNNPTKDNIHYRLRGSKKKDKQ